jgi:hypothetical protein
VRIDAPVDEAAQVEPVEDAGQRRALVTEAALELADRLRAAAVQLNEDVRLRLSHIEAGRGPFDVKPDQVRAALDVPHCSHIGISDIVTVVTDEEFLGAFERGEIQAADFPHEAHLRVARLLAGEPEGYARLADGIRGIAARAGRPGVFHETITRAWFELVRSVGGPAPELHDRTLLTRYYSAEALAAGRERWIEPDLAPLRLPPPAARDGAARG